MFKIRTTDGVCFQGSPEASVLDNALQAGHFFEYSCRNGQCGVCKTGLLHGEIAEVRPQYALSEEDRKNGKILSCCCAPRSNLLIDAKELSALQAVPVQTLPMRIEKIVLYSERIVEVEFRFPPTANFQYLEGQYIDVIGLNGIRRSYSIANCSAEKNIRLFIRRVDGGVLSKYWFEEARPNDLLRMEGPKGTFYFRGFRKHIVFLATGTGIAPVKAILDRLERENPGSLRGSRFFLYWGNRDVDDFFWEPSYSSLNLAYVPVLSRPTDRWRGRMGYVQDALLEDRVHLEDAEVYACGSLAMIESAYQKLAAAGLPDGRFHSDAFVSSS